MVSDSLPNNAEGFVGYTFADMLAKKSSGRASRLRLKKELWARFEPASDQSLLIYFGDKITIDANEQVCRLLHLLETEPIAGVRNMHPAYYSLLVQFDASQWQHEKLKKELRKHLGRLDKVQLPDPRQVEIPVCYGGEFGPDLKEVAALHGITPEDIVKLHSSATYLVYFLGFVPGFAYLGELPSALVTPRLATPRKKVAKGSVGIAGNQTGVYPFETPGGWRLLGRTPVSMFRTDRNGLSLLSMGDRVRFVPISRQRFAEFSHA